MTTTSDWPQGLDPMPSIEPSSDLFDGDILGDELIDIYNAAVVGGGDESMNEIPTLLAPTPAPGTEKKEATHLRALPLPGAPSLDSDDGLGAFRPSTSFNDLSTLVPPNASVNNGKSAKMTPVVSSATLASKGTETKKRPAPISSAEGTAAKRRASGSSRKNVGGSKPKTKGASSKAGKGVFNGKPSNNTPNPLTSGGKLAVAAPGGNNPQPIKPIVKPPAIPLALPKVKVEEKSSDILPSAPTEADFKSVAQAAVSNLIANAGNKSENVKKSSSSADDESVDKIDTSTEHIKALTGTNWVTVCSDGQSSNASADKMNNRARRQNLTPDERARQNRDRNREHARNTRLRKKAYVEELKRTLTALVSQRDAAELEKRHSSQREMEQREVRFRVVEEFLKLRGRNEINHSRWAAILEDTFTMTLPNTDYRDMAGERGHFEQKLCGVSQVMADSSMFAEFLQTLGKVGAGQPISFVYNCDRKNFFMDNCTAVMNWMATSCGATHQGAQAELALKGTINAKFSPASNKLISVAMSFDTGIILSQVNHAFKYTEYAAGEDAEDAAQVAASEADAILDSLQMPHIGTSVPNKVNVVPVVSAASITDGEKSDSSDESNGDADDGDKPPTGGRRSVSVA